MNKFPFFEPDVITEERLINLQLKQPLELQNEIVMESVISADTISIVVPVKNNQKGVTRFLETLGHNMTAQDYPCEVIVVDNNSDTPLALTQSYPFSVTVLECKKIGPGAARNMGARLAKGKWILFTDSDCVATPTLVSGYCKTNNACIAYAGMVNIKGDDALSRYYRDAKVLMACAVYENNKMAPWTIVTANCLVLKSAFTAVGGFNEKFIYAGGEDSDLGYRLRMIGVLAYGCESIACHEFNDGFTGFIQRFIRYGRGQRLIDEHYQGEQFRSSTVKPRTLTQTNIFLANVQETALNWGYQLEELKELI
jgi:glycosyltransferase involved in cell wall biosynthesis